MFTTSSGSIRLGCLNDKREINRYLAENYVTNNGKRVFNEVEMSALENGTPLVVEIERHNALDMLSNKDIPVFSKLCVLTPIGGEISENRAKWVAKKYSATMGNRWVKAGLAKRIKQADGEMYLSFTPKADYLFEFIRTNKGK